MKRFRSLASFAIALALVLTGLQSINVVASANTTTCSDGFFFDATINGCKSVTAGPAPVPNTQPAAGTTNYQPPATGGLNCTGNFVPNATGTACIAPIVTTPNPGTQGITCPAGQFFDQGINGCKSITAGPTTAVATTTPCMNGMVRDANGSCIAPVVGTTNPQGFIDCNVAANKALSQCGGATAMPNTGTVGGTTIDCKSTAYANTLACTGGGTASAGSTMMNCKGGVYTVEQCNNPNFVGGAPGTTATGGTNTMNTTGCMNGMVRDPNGSCIAPVLSNTGQIDCSAAANKVTTACGGTVVVQIPTAANTNNNWINCGAGFFYDEGIKGCKSTGATGGVVNQVATIKCKDGSVRVTAIECDNVGGGAAGVAITCPSNQVPSPSGTYCIYPNTGTNNANAGTYRAECAANPPPASCLGQAVNTFEGNATMAKAANFTAFDANSVQIRNGVALNESGQQIGQLARTSSGQSFSVAAPPPPPATPSASGKKAAPAPKKKASTAPVILLNVTDSNGEEVKDSSGKALTTAPVVKQGNFVFSDRNGKPVMATPTLDQNGKPVEHNGKVLYTKLVTIAGQEALTDADGNAIMAVPLLNEKGEPIVAKNGEVLYAPPLTNALGETIINEKTKQPVLATPMADADGNAALGANKKPFMGQPILNADNQVLTVAGQPVYTGAAGMPATTPKLQQIKSAQGQDLQFAFGGTLVDEGGNTVLGPDGRPTLLSVNATPLMANGLPLVDKNGKPCRVNNKGQVTDSSGRLILGTDGKPMALGKWETFEPVRVGAAKTTVKDPTGKTAVLGLNAQLFDSKGNPIVSATGAPIYFDGRTKSLIDNRGKVIRVDNSGKVPGKIATLAFQTVTFAA